MATSRHRDGSKANLPIHEHTENPSTAWEQIKVQRGRIHKSLPVPSLDTPRQEGHIRVVCISDTHSKLGVIMNKIPEGDILIHAGDFTRCGDLREVEKFNQELGELDFKHKIVIAGNHELTFDKKVDARSFRGIFDRLALDSNLPKRPSDLLTNCTYLEDSSVRVMGYNFYGSPHTPAFHGWAFNVRRGQNLMDIWNKIPTKTDILITHGPAVGYGDLIHCGYEVGCVELLTTIEQRIKPMYHIFGHIHEDYGMWTNGTTTFINASICNLGYRAVNNPVIFDLPIREASE